MTRDRGSDEEHLPPGSWQVGQTVWCRAVAGGRQAARSPEASGRGTEMEGVGVGSESIPPTLLAKPCAPAQQLLSRGHSFFYCSRGSPSPRCCECSASLSHQYYEKDGQLFCKKDYWARYGESCHGCSEHITKGLVMVSAVTGAWRAGAHACTGFPALDLSCLVPFTGSLIPHRLLSLFVHLYPSAPCRWSQLARSLPGAALL